MKVSVNKSQIRVVFAPDQLGAPKPGEVFRMYVQSVRDGAFTLHVTKAFDGARGTPCRVTQHGKKTPYLCLARARGVMDGDTIAGGSIPFCGSSPATLHNPLDMDGWDIDVANISEYFPHLAVGRGTITQYPIDPPIAPPPHLTLGPLTFQPATFSPMPIFSAVELLNSMQAEWPHKFSMELRDGRLRAIMEFGA